MNKTSVSNYYYGSYINYKAFKDYHLNNNLDDNYFKANHCLILAFIVERYHKHKKMPQINHEGKKYVLMNTNYVLDNLIFVKIKSRQFKSCLAQLKTNGIIKVLVVEKTNRYIHVTDELIELCFSKHWTTSPIDYLIDNAPELWKRFKNEWQPHFKNTEEFKTFIDLFNLQRQIEEENFNTKEIYEHLINSVRYKLYGKSMSYQRMY